jgi:hypothetical protein
VADITPFIPALTGEEIIQDLCGAVAEKLRSDCNMRPIDGYAGGYKATVKIHIEAFGLDATTVDYEVSTDESGPAKDVDGNAVDLENPDLLIDTELEIPQEEDLSLVRERSNQPTPDFEMKSTPEITEEGPVGQPQKRKYTRRLRALVSAQGGAAGTMEE